MQYKSNMKLQYAYEYNANCLKLDNFVYDHKLIDLKWLIFAFNVYTYSYMFEYQWKFQTYFGTCMWKYQWNCKRTVAWQSVC